jgi:kynureninase
MQMQALPDRCYMLLFPDMNTHFSEPFTTSTETAERLDDADVLKDFRDAFYIPKHTNGTDTLYFCGNSLGLQPKATQKYIEQELEDWARLGVEGHFHARNPWMPYHEFLTDSTARIVGALPTEVVNMNHLSVNLHLLMVSFYRPQKGKAAILIEKGAFPSDRYAVASQIKFHGFDPDTELLEIAPRAGENTLRTEDILSYIEAHGRRIALILMGGVNYYTGQAFDMKAITQAGHQQQCRVGFDLAHAAGNILLQLHDWNVDFAAWCTYKYLNGGPGGVGGCFIHEQHHTDKSLHRFAGWWGQNKEIRFKMGPDFEPIETAEGWQLSNAPILSMAALNASMELFARAGMHALRNKSEQLTAYAEFLIHAHNSRASNAVEIITPANPKDRGCQLSLRAGGTQGKAVFDALIQAGVIADWRYPDVIRIAPVPMYNSFKDVYDFTHILFSILNA